MVNLPQQFQRCPVTTNPGTGPDFTLTFGAITGGLPNEAVRRVGVTILDKVVTVDTSFTVTPTYSTGAGTPLVVTMPTDPTLSNLDTFLGFSAPAGASISSLAFDFTGTDTANSRFGIDDLAFITAVPEPGAVGFLALGAMALLRRRRAAR